MSSDGEPSVFFLPPPPWTNYVGIDDYRTKHSDKLPIIIDNGNLSYIEFLDSLNSLLFLMEIFKRKFRVQSRTTEYKK